MPIPLILKFALSFSFLSLALNITAIACTTLANSTLSSFNLTAISAANNASILECWQITLPLSTSHTAGIQGAAIQQLGNLSSMSWGSLPGGFAGEAHPAPCVQYNVILSGTLHITIPGSAQEVTVVSGKRSLLIAADTVDVSGTGHVSSLVGDEEGTSLMMPTENNEIPPHRVMHAGACQEQDLEL